MSSGRYIVIEGAEGAGKTTQLLLLANKLRAAGLSTRIFTEPDNRSNLTSRTINLIANHPSYPMNNRTEVLLYNAARVQSLEIIRRSVLNGVYCLCDRNYLTTLVSEFYGRGDTPEYETINQIVSFAVDGIEPDLTVIIDAPLTTLLDRLRLKTSDDNPIKVDESLLERIRAGYLWEANQRQYPVVFSTKDIDETSNEIWKLILPVIANRSPSSAALAEPASIKEILNEKISMLGARGETEPSDVQAPIDKAAETRASTGLDDGPADIFTNTSDNIYGFTDKLSQTDSAFLLTKMKHQSKDIRKIILDDHKKARDGDSNLKSADKADEDNEDVKLLVSHYVVAERVSSLLARKIERGRSAVYIEPSNRYLSYQKDENGHFAYYIPKSLNAKVKSTYTKKINTIFTAHQELIDQLTSYIRHHSKTPRKDRSKAWQNTTKQQARDTAMLVLPVATMSSVGIYGSVQSIESLISRLQSDGLAESRDVANKILDNMAKSSPQFYAKISKPGRDGAAPDYRAETAGKLRQLTEKYLPHNYINGGGDLSLVNYFPKNELDLVPDMLYENTHLSIGEIKKQVDSWSLKKKTDVFEGYLGERLNRQNKPGRVIEKAHYSWDIVCDYESFRYLQRHRQVDNLVWQNLSPIYGYDTPDLIDEAGLTDKFQDCFRESVELYSVMQAAGYSEESQYVTLFGHKMRCQLTYNAREAYHLLESVANQQSNSGYRKLLIEMHEKLAEIHPLMGGSIKFVDEDKLSGLS